MNDREMRAECVRVASENWRQLLATSPRIAQSADLDTVARGIITDADKLFEYVWNATVPGALKAVA